MTIEMFMGYFIAGLFIGALLGGPVVLVVNSILKTREDKRRREKTIERYVSMGFSYEEAKLLECCDTYEEFKTHR